jgi:glutamate carboxypeptidase
VRRSVRFFETAIGLNTGYNSSRRGASWTLNVTAKTGHSPGCFSSNSGYGAIYESARILNDFRLQLSQEKVFDL